MHFKKQPGDHILRNRAIGDGNPGGELITLFLHLSKELCFPPMGNFGSILQKSLIFSFTFK